MSVVVRGGKPYLYRPVRRNGRVTSEYVASGDEALELARMIVAVRHAAAESRRRERDEERANSSNSTVSTRNWTG